MIYLILAPGTIEDSAELSNERRSSGHGCLLVESRNASDYDSGMANGYHIRVFAHWLMGTLREVLSSREYADLANCYDEVSPASLATISDPSLRLRVAAFINDFMTEWENNWCDFARTGPADEYAFENCCENCEERAENDGECPDRCDSYYEYFDDYLSENSEYDTNILDRWWRSREVGGLPLFN